MSKKRHFSRLYQLVMDGQENIQGSPFSRLREAEKRIFSTFILTVNLFRSLPSCNGDSS